jgi:glycosyltransferase involved in cell wall biosynthesis
LASKNAPITRHTGGRRNGKKGLNRRDPEAFSIVVHSHLCWDWVWQRPQQFLSRLSQRHRVLFVETVGPDPELVTPLARLTTAPDFPQVSILRVQFPSWRWADGDFVDAERRRIVQDVLGGPLTGQFKQRVQWFYDPMAVTAFAGQLGEAAIVYDCMDELSQFRFAPAELKSREKELLDHADVVFTGGRRLFEAKRQQHSNCHFYGCGVDVAHFGLARLEETAVPADVAGLPQPVLGYFGVIDERIDYELLAKLADAEPSWSIVMVGPVSKVEESALPRRPNLHWLGRRAYEELPAVAKGFQVCLMPFALNEATEFINPTKSLEYMATGRMIVSSAVPDVVANFGSIVKVARSHEEFIEACREAVRQPNENAIRSGLEMAAANTWESIVAKLEEHVAAALRKPAARASRLNPLIAHGAV